MAQIDLIEETFVAASPALVSAAVRDPAFSRDLWPDVSLAVFMDRGDAGLRWTATGGLIGSAEIWLEPFGDGVIAHTYLRADPPSPLHWRKAVAETQRRARHLKAVWWRLKDTVEAGREPGTPARSAATPARSAATPARDAATPARDAATPAREPGSAR
ncbi:MAG: hypothetical protein QOD41_3991 [Cryptosporangiaceae bacterium]|nr:hypothetical protein [Cryptosporangiaceae bacterium]